MSSPELRVHNDYDRYFQRLVDSWIQRKCEEGRVFAHTAVVVTAGPWRPDAVTTRSAGGVLFLDFYSAIRTGFGRLSAEDVDAIVGML